MIQAINSVAKTLGCYKSILDCSLDKEPFYVKCGYHNSGAEMSFYYEEEKDAYHRGWNREKEMIKTLNSLKYPSKEYRWLGCLYFTICCKSSRGYMQWMSIWLFHFKAPDSLYMQNCAWEVNIHHTSTHLMWIQRKMSAGDFGHTTLPHSKPCFDCYVCGSYHDFVNKKIQRDFRNVSKWNVVKKYWGIQYRGSDIG